MSALTLVTASTEEPISRAETKLWLRLDEHQVSEDPLIDALIARARQRWEEVTQRAALVQTYDFYLDAIPNDGCPVSLPKAPLVGVTAITGYQTSDATDTTGVAMSTSGYYVDTAHEFGRVMPVAAFAYPTATRQINPLIIRFTAGYSTSTTGVPEDVKTDIKALVARLYEHRGDELEQAKALASYVPADLELPTWG